MVKWSLAAAVVAAGVFAFGVTFITFTFYNDHFGRLAPARQIARYGELPFRDFFEPGFVLTEFASAGVQLLIGDNLLGEMLLASACIAVGAGAIVVLVHRLTASIPLALVTAAAATMASPRPYDYDKFLFYPVALLVCWRYADRRSPRALLVAAAVIVVAGMFRYDNGLIATASAMALIATIHAKDRRLVLRRSALFVGACVACAIPYLLFLQSTGGVAPALAQMATYAVREGSHTRLAAFPDPFGGAREWSWSPAAAAAALFYLFLALPLTAIVVSARRSAVSPSERARVWSAAAMSLIVAAVILREPLTARIGGAIAPAAVLASWLWSRSARFRVLRPAVALLVLAILARATDWRATIDSVQVKTGRTGQVVADASTTPSPISLMGTTRLAGVVDYVRRCTLPEDRIFAAWFAPELYFLSGRGFAGGIAAAFGGHWSEPAYQRRIVDKMRTEDVPIVLLREGDESFFDQYPIVASYLRSRYQPAGSHDFGEVSGERFVVMTPTGRTMTGRDPLTTMPCFAAVS